MRRFAAEFDSSSLPNRKLKMVVRSSRLPVIPLSCKVRNGVFPPMEHSDFLRVHSSMNLLLTQWHLINTGSRRIDGHTLLFDQLRTHIIIIITALLRMENHSAADVVRFASEARRSH